jgi:dipeptidyl aminopeptidase/acylaminoacyl peptidase
MQAKQSTPLIPRKVFFDNPDKTLVRLSPNGEYLSYLAPVNGVLNVWVTPRTDLGAAKPVTKDTFRGIRFYDWAHTNEHILYIQDKNGDENWRIYAVNLTTEETKDLTPYEGVQARIEKTSRHFSSEILASMNDRQAQFHDLYRLNITTGERTLLLQNDHFAGFDCDDQFQLRVVAQMTEDGGMQLQKPTSEGGWELFQEIPSEDMLTTSSIGFDQSGKRLYMADSRERDTSALYILDMETGVRTLLAEDPRADLEEVVIHPTEKTVQAASFNYERSHWLVLDPAMETHLTHLESVDRGEVRIASRTLDDLYWVVVYLKDDGPRHYYLYHCTTQEASFLFTDRKELQDQPLSRMHAVVIPSRDGMNLVSYYTLPPSYGEAIVPDKPLPMVLSVHGGPWGRDGWGFNPFHQWLANRGYATLSVNFRASTGFGKAFANAGDKEWGAKMHDDLVDAVNWAIQAGIADPDKVAILGGSYGGYATLVGLTFTPELFVCGVDIVGPSNLITLLETVPPYWKPMFKLFSTRVGDPTTEEGRELLKARSPLTYAERIQRPLLIAQGANDPRVKQAESDQIIQAMQEKAIPVTYALYPDEGHGFARPENWLSFTAVTEAFLADVLGGRCEPVGTDFKRSSITVPVGAELVPGLMEALEKQEASA